MRSCDPQVAVHLIEEERQACLHQRTGDTQAGFRMAAGQRSNSERLVGQQKRNQRCGDQNGYAPGEAVPDTSLSG